MIFRALALIALLGSTTPALAESLPSLASVHAETVLILNDINLAHLEGLERCLCEITQNENQACRRYDSTREEFSQIILNISGELRETQISCATAVDRLLRNRIRLSYREMARSLAKRGPARRDFSSIAERLDQSERVHWNPSPAHPVDSFGLSFLPIRSPQLDREDYAAIRDSFRAASRTYCQDYISRPNLQARLQFAIPSLRGASLCDILLGDLPRHPRSLSLQSEFSDYYPYAAARRDREFRANAEKDYVEKVNRNPLLLFLANSNPTDQELLAATSQVASLARARKERLLEIRLSARNDSDLAPFTRIKAALPYTRARARALGLDPKSFEPNFADWLEEMTDHEFNNMLREAGVALGLTAACFAPWGRAVGAVAGRIVRAGCLTGVGLPLNTYFLWDAWDNYHEALLLALSAIEPGQQFSNFQRVESERSKINFFALLLPVGLNLKSAREAASALRALLFH